MIYPFLLWKKTTCSMSLSVSCEDFSKDVIVPLKCLEGIWEKAVQLLNTDGAIVPAPGQKLESRIVLSYSGKILTWLVTSKLGTLLVMLTARIGKV